MRTRRTSREPPCAPAAARTRCSSNARRAARCTGCCFWATACWTSSASRRRPSTGTARRPSRSSSAPRTAAGRGRAAPTGSTRCASTWTACSPCHTPASRSARSRRGRALHGQDRHQRGAPRGLPDRSRQLCDAIVEDARTAVRTLGLRLAGVDLVTADPSRPLRETGGVINEVNGTPALHRHYQVSDRQNVMPVAEPVLAHPLGLEPDPSRPRRRAFVEPGPGLAGRPPGPSRGAD